ncbi:DUF389 domain-containing protein [Alloprevotella sp. OH1205_COT-284]|uniref:DUF389 domain-containing protein n=1 Tax=Alloprevotella sp. OH1205_COT-284 TaxID=2491043 RepID=UPI000F5DAC6C|nr:DUF389 domain-containing protein [Alloprevotella sp. OH1205_COT-284]RRD79894.1 DUF389 domain-containing protein [Alloprevotella sp. OH1205_COT-284]
MSQNFSAIFRIVKGYFNVMHEKEDEQAIIDNIRAGINFRGANSWVLIFAIFIASLGLNVNSTAVIIGAMLISPLMGPIIGIGLSVGINDLELLKHSYRNLGAATIISVLTATLYFLITPLDEAQSELLARTSPTIYDVLIALCGGAAGFLAMATKAKGSNVIPGVAIATALMPPLCTAGYGLAMGNWAYFLGAFYLFFINTVFICLATIVGVRMMNFSYRQAIDTERFKKVRKYIIAIVIVTMVPAVYFTSGIVRDSFRNNNVRKFVNAELAGTGTHILSTSLDTRERVLNVVAVGREITSAAQRAAEERLERYNLKGYRLLLIQGTQSDSLLTQKTQIGTPTLSTDKKHIAEQAARIRQLEARLEPFERHQNLSGEVALELQPLFPSVASLALMPMTEARTDTAVQKTQTVAIVRLAPNQTLSTTERERLKKWLATRTKGKDIRLILQ